jgi:putative oxidoreductase
MNESVGKLILRLTLGILILLHGIAKLTGGVGGLSGMVTAAGLPAFVTYGVYVGEVIAPILVILGWYSRIGAAVIAINMIFAIALAHGAELVSLGRRAGGRSSCRECFFSPRLPWRSSVRGASA